MCAQIRSIQPPSEYQTDWFNIMESGFFFFLFCHCSRFWWSLTKKLFFITPDSVISSSLDFLRPQKSEKNSHLFWHYSVNRRDFFFNFVVFSQCFNFRNEKTHTHNCWQKLRIPDTVIWCKLSINTQSIVLFIYSLLYESYYHYLTLLYWCKGLILFALLKLHCPNIVHQFKVHIFAHCQFSEFSFILFLAIFLVILLVKNCATKFFSWNSNIHF